MLTAGLRTPFYGPALARASLSKTTGCEDRGHLTWIEVRHQGTALIVLERTQGLPHRPIRLSCCVREGGAGTPSISVARGRYGTKLEMHGAHSDLDLKASGIILQEHKPRELVPP
jgi:hypothetical protein